MAFDGLVMANICHELNENLINGRISKISMPNKDELIFNIKNNSKNFKLLISANASLPLIYITQFNKENPKIAPTFCMFLRKYLNSARIISIDMPSLERILTITFEHNNELGDKSYKKLIFEMMGKHSNIIFTDTNLKILDSIKRINATTSSIREILPGKYYFLPKELTKINPLEINFESFYTLAKNSNIKILNFLYLNYAGISPLIADELCFRAKLDPDAIIKDLDERQIKSLYNIFDLLLEKIKNKSFKPQIIFKNEEAVEFSSIELDLYSSNIFEKINYNSISELIYSYYSAKDLNIRIKQKSSDLRKIISNLLERNVKKYDLQKKQLLDTDKMNQFKIYADLITTYAYNLESSSNELICQNYYDNNKEIRIPLDNKIKAIENAKKYYDKYSKLKRTKIALDEQIRKTELDILHLNSILNNLGLSTNENDLEQIKNELIEYSYIKKGSNTKKSKIISKPLHFISSDGFHIFVGKNNYQNEELSFKLAQANDWWFHAKNIPGSHVIVKSENKELSDICFEEAAALAAYYSSNKSNDKVEVDYLQKRNLKKVPNSPPGFVIYHNNWSINIKPSNKLKSLDQNN